MKKGEGESGKRGKIRKKRQNLGITLPLLTDRAGYATIYQLWRVHSPWDKSIFFLYMHHMFPI